MIGMAPLLATFIMVGGVYTAISVNNATEIKQNVSSIKKVDVNSIAFSALDLAKASILAGGYESFISYNIDETNTKYNQLFSKRLDKRVHNIEVSGGKISIGYQKVLDTVRVLIKAEKNERIAYLGVTFQIVGQTSVLPVAYAGGGSFSGGSMCTMGYDEENNVLGDVMNPDFNFYLDDNFYASPSFIIPDNAPNEKDLQVHTNSNVYVSGYKAIDKIYSTGNVVLYNGATVDEVYAEGDIYTYSGGNAGTSVEGADYDYPEITKTFEDNAFAFSPLNDDGSPKTSITCGVNACKDLEDIQAAAGGVGDPCAAYSTNPYGSNPLKGAWDWGYAGDKTISECLAQYFTTEYTETNNPYFSNPNKDSWDWGYANSSLSCAAQYPSNSKPLSSLREAVAYPSSQWIRVRWYGYPQEWASSSKIADSNSALETKSFNKALFGYNTNASLSSFLYNIYSENTGLISSEIGYKYGADNPTSNCSAYYASGGGSVPNSTTLQVNASIATILSDVTINDKDALTSQNNSTNHFFPGDLTQNKDYRSGYKKHIVEINDDCKRRIKFGNNLDIINIDDNAEFGCNLVMNKGNDEVYIDGYLYGALSFKNNWNSNNILRVGEDTWIDIDMEPGNDRVWIGEDAERKVYLGDGNDKLFIADDSKKDIFGGSGIDVIYIGDEVRDDIDLGAGDDTLYIGGTIYNGRKVYGGGGTDIVYLGNYTKSQWNSSYYLRNKFEGFESYVMQDGVVSSSSNENQDKIDSCEEAQRNYYYAKSGRDFGNTTFALNPLIANKIEKCQEGQVAYDNRPLNNIRNTSTDACDLGSSKRNEYDSCNASNPTPVCVNATSKSLPSGNYDYLIIGNNCDLDLTGDQYTFTEIHVKNNGEMSFADNNVELQSNSINIKNNSQFSYTGTSLDSYMVISTNDLNTGSNSGISCTDPRLCLLDVNNITTGNNNVIQGSILARDTLNIQNSEVYGNIIGETANVSSTDMCNIIDENGNQLVAKTYFDISGGDAIGVGKITSLIAQVICKSELDCIDQMNAQ